MKQILEGAWHILVFSYWQVTLSSELLYYFIVATDLRTKHNSTLILKFFLSSPCSMNDALYYDLEKNMA